MSNLAVARALLECLSAGGDRSRLAELYHPEIEQTEYPNRLLPQGATRRWPDLTAAWERGARVVAGERYELRASLEQGDRVALEVGWSAELLVPIAAAPAGAALKADFAVFLTFRDGRIVSQHNYDCFHPF